MSKLNLPSWRSHQIQNRQHYAWWATYRHYSVKKNKIDKKSEAFTHTPSISAQYHGTICPQPESSIKNHHTSLITEEEEFSHLIQYRCLAHVFNLIGATLSKDFYVRIILDDLVKLIQCINKRQSLVAAISSRGGNRVVECVPTRWYSTCASINSVLRLEVILKNFEDDETYATSKWKPIVHNDRFWDGLRECKLYFDCLSSIIGLIFQACHPAFQAKPQKF